MPKKKIFDDGSSIEWISKEGLKYAENGYSVLVWVDYEPGFFNNSRIIKSSSLIRWQIKPNGMPDVIDEIKKNEIIEKAKEYFDSKGVRCRVE